MKKFIATLLALVFTNIALSETKYTFINHEKVENLEYKLFEYQDHNIYVPVINGILPEITFKGNQEVIFDYVKKIKLNNVKIKYEIEKTKQEVEKNNKIEEKLKTINNKLIDVENNIKAVNAFVASSNIESNFQNENTNFKLEIIEETILELIEKIKELKSKSDFEKTMNLIDGMRLENQNKNIPQKSDVKIQETPKKPDIPKIEEKSLGLKKPSQVIK